MAKYFCGICNQYFEPDDDVIILIAEETLGDGYYEYIHKKCLPRSVDAHVYKRVSIHKEMKARELETRTQEIMQGYEVCRFGTKQDYILSVIGKCPVPPTLIELFGKQSVCKNHKTLSTMLSTLKKEGRIKAFGRKGSYRYMINQETKSEQVPPKD